MKNLIIAAIVMFTCTFTQSANAQSTRSLQGKVERLKEKIKEQEKEVRGAQGKVDEIQKELKNEIEQQKEEAKENPKDHGPNEKLEELRKKLKEAEKNLESEQKKLKELKEDLKKAEEKLEKKLGDAIDDLLKKYPLPDDTDKLEEYEKDMEKLETNPRNEDLEKELRERMKKKIEEKRKELEEETSAAQHFNFIPSGGPEPSHGKLQGGETKGRLTGGIRLDSWLRPEELFSNDLFEALRDGIYSNPELFEKLYEMLGGEFFIGSFSSSPEFSNQTTSPLILFGFNAGYQWTDNINVEAGFSFGTSSSTAEFPVTVIDTENGETGMVKGTIGRKNKTYRLTLAGNYEFIQGKVRPYAGAGVVLHHTPETEIMAEIVGEAFSIGKSEAETAIELKLQAGMTYEFIPRLGVSFEIQVAKARAFYPGASLGLHWNF